jgi:mannose-6-phosphate isomerase-like protein (cupin superfamily)
MSKYHHQRLPGFSTLLSGHTPPNEIGFKSDKLQIWYNNTEGTWADPTPHYHTESDEIFIVLKGSLLVEVDGERFVVGEREFCCFPAGVNHCIIEVHPPVESLMIRAPSVADKIYVRHQTDAGDTTLSG